MSKMDEEKLQKDGDSGTPTGVGSNVFYLMLIIGILGVIGFVLVAAGGAASN